MAVISVENCASSQLTGIQEYKIPFFHFFFFFLTEIQLGLKLDEEKVIKCKQLDVYVGYITDVWV